MLAFKLDPAIARNFGKAAVATVTGAEGMLVDSEISGVDAGSDIAAATRSEGQLAEELRRVEAQLARGGLGSAERAELQVQADRLRESIRAARATRAESRESLAKTPMVFNYGSGDVVPGFDDRSPIRTALKDAGDNIVGAIATMLVIGLTLLPWALLLLLLAWLYRRFLRGSIARLGVAPGPEREPQPA
jgi:hypothetical protein